MPTFVLHVLRDCVGGLLALNEDDAHVYLKNGVDVIEQLMKGMKV
jgi:hypothetical protein